MKVVLAEKPSVALDIAKFLGAKQKCDGYYAGNGYFVTFAFGHLVSLQEPQDYDPKLKRWELASLPFIPEKFQLKVIKQGSSQKQFRTIKELFKQAELIIGATDAGREGELIFRYILSMCGCENKPAKRLWLSSLTDEALRDAFQKLYPKEHFDSLYEAAMSRSEADWIVGLNATRNQTVRYSLGRQLWSVGRVQTPVLALIARRNDEIDHFIPQAFWELFTKYREVDFKHNKRFAKEEEAKALEAKVVDSELCVKEVKKKKEQVKPPLLFDLTELQRELNKSYQR